MKTKLMRDASYLLPPPGSEVVRECLDTIDKQQSKLRTLAGAMLKAHRCSYGNYSSGADGCLLDIGESCCYGTDSTCSHYNKCQCPACKLAREIIGG